MLSLWKDQPGRYFGISTKSATDGWRDKMFRKTDQKAIRDYIEANGDKDLYMTAHGFSRPVRQKEYAVDPCLLYSDMDECDPRTCAIKPTVAIESSPGRYVGYWLTDKPASEELNRRLSYMLKVDKSGWDRTQVLRIPGTRNYKYPSAPRVKLLWKDGPRYTIKDLERRIPKISGNGHDAGDGDAAAVFKKYEKKLSRWARKELIAGRPKVGQRSEVLWKLHNECLEAGMTRDEAFTILWASPWNKFANRRNGADQLYRELDKAMDQHFTAPPVREEEKSWNPLPCPIRDIEEETIDWLIPGFLAHRELTIVEGDPGLGKSYFMQMVAKAVCDGERLPVFGRKRMLGGTVAYFDTENTASTVTKPRLLENGLVHSERFFQGEEPFSVDDSDQWDLVLERLEEIRPTMVVFDTINTYIGGADTHRASETQQAMSFFKEIAVRFDCCVVVLRHLTKSSGGEKALYRGQGSIAFAGAARIVATVGQHPESSDERVVACTKINIGTPFKSFSFSIQGLPDTLKRSNRSVFVWGEGVDYTADELMAKTSTDKNQDFDHAVKFLKETLAEGPVDVQKVTSMAEARGISRRTLYRAATSLSVERKSSGFGSAKKTDWSLS